MIKAVGLFLLSLLQVLGWILLLLFAVFVVLLLAALFVPVRYQVLVQNKKALDLTAVKFLDKLRAQVKVGWLFRMVSFTVDYQGPQGAAVRIRLAGIDLGKVRAWFLRKKGMRRSRQDAVKTTEVSGEERPFEERTGSNCGEPPPGGDAASDQTEQAFEKTLPAGEKTGSGPTESPDLSAHNAPALEHTDHKKTAHRKQALRKKKKRFRQTSGREAGKKPMRGRAKIIEKLRRFKQEFTDETNRSAVNRLWIELCRILRSYMPGKIEADLTFSMADPARTGQVLGLISMMPLVYRYPCAIAADFESDRLYIEGEVLLGGKVTLIVFLVSAVRLLLHKEFMKAVRRLTGRGKKQASG